MAKPIKIEILGDASSFKKAAGDVDGSASGLGDTAKKLAIAMAGAFALDKLKDFGVAMFGLSSDLELQNTKITTVFAEQEGMVREWADGVNEAFGLTETGVANLAASTADLLKPMGFTADAAAKMSTEMVGLAPALSQWSAGQYDAAQVSEIMQKALLGETDGLKALGISISAAESDARALAIAQADGRTEVTAMDKAMAIQALIMEKSTDAQAAYSGGTDTLAGKQAFLKAKLAELKEYIAMKLTPVFIAAGDFVVQKVVPALQAFAEKARELWSEHGPKLVAAFTALKDGFQTVFAFITDNKPVLIGLSVAIGVGLVAAFTAWAVSAAAAAAATLVAMAPVIAIGVAIAAVTAAVVYAYQNWEGFRNIVDKVAGFLKNTLWPALQTVASFIKDALVPRVQEFVTAISKWITAGIEVAREVKNKIQEVIDKVTSIVQAIKDANISETLKAPFRAAIDWIKDQWDSLKRKLTVKIDIPNPLSGLSGLIPGRAYGGPMGQAGPVTVGERGPETVYLPKGSTVAPAHQSGGSSGASVVVNVASNANPQAIAAELAWALRTSGR